MGKRRRASLAAAVQSHFINGRGIRVTPLVYALRQAWDGSNLARKFLRLCEPFH
jgi:hypothetical protein